MKYFLIKPLNCIVSDSQIQEGDYYFDPNLNLIRVSYKDSSLILTKGVVFKIEYSNNLEGLKHFELVDEVEELANLRYIKHEAKPEWMLSLNEEIQRTGGYKVGFKEGYKAKAGYTESDKLLIEAKELIKYFVDRCEAGTIRSKTTYAMYKNFLAKSEEQDSKLIEVQIIKDSVFKIINEA